MPDIYSFYIEDDGEDIYYYFTSKAATYTVYFRPNEYTSHIEEYPSLLENAFGFGFFQFPNEIGAILPVDSKIKHTIEQIICDFFSSKSKRTVLLYHCDYSDGRQGKRSNKFNRWYNDAPARVHIKKHEIAIEVRNNSENTNYTTHYIGYLCPNENPDADVVYKEFEDFAASLVSEDK